MSTSSQNTTVSAGDRQPEAARPAAAISTFNSWPLVSLSPHSPEHEARPQAQFQIASLVDGW